MRAKINKKFDGNEMSLRSRADKGHKQGLSGAKWESRAMSVKPWPGDETWVPSRSRHVTAKLLSAPCRRRYLWYSRQTKTQPWPKNDQIVPICKAIFKVLVFGHYVVCGEKLVGGNTGTCKPLPMCYFIASMSYTCLGLPSYTFMFAFFHSDILCAHSGAGIAY